MDKEPTPPLTLLQKLAYGFGSSPSATTSNCIGFFYMIFVLETCKILPSNLMVILFVGRVWDALTDPFVGYLVSITNTRLGKIRPWLIFTAPFGAISYLLVFYCLGDNMPGSFAYYFISYLLYQFLLTSYHVPYTSYVMRITDSREERDALSAYRIGNECVSMLIALASFGGITGMKRLVNNCESEHNMTNGLDSSNKTFTAQEIQEERDYYLLAAGIISIWYLLSGWLCAFMVKERVADDQINSSTLTIASSASKMDSSEIIIKTGNNSYWKKFRTLVKFKPYGILMWAFLASSLGIQSVQNALSIYVTHSLEIPGQLNYALVSLLLVSTMTIPLAHQLSTRVGKKRMYIVGNILMIPAIIISIVLPAKPSLWLFYPAFLFAGFCFGIIYLMPWSMLPDVIQEYHKTKSHEMWIEEAVFYSFYVFFTKFAVGVAGSFISLVLELAKFDVTKNCGQPKEVGLYIRYTIFPFAIFSLLVASVIIYFYPIDERKAKHDHSNQEITISPSAKKPDEERKEMSGDLIKGANGRVANSPWLPSLQSYAVDGGVNQRRQSSTTSRSRSSMKLSRQDLEAFDAAITGHSGVSPAPYWEKGYRTLSRKQRQRTISDNYPAGDQHRPNICLQRSMSRQDNPLLIFNQLMRDNGTVIEEKSSSDSSPSRNPTPV